LHDWVDDPRNELRYYEPEATAKCAIFSEGISPLQPPPRQYGRVHYEPIDNPFAVMP
jgi:hypothetical protein